MKWKPDSKSVLAIVFIAILLIGGISTILLNPVKVFGGLVRGYTEAPEGSNVLQKIGNAFKTFEERVSYFFSFHDASIHVYGGIQRLLGRTLINDVDSAHNIIRLKNGSLTFKTVGTTSLSDVRDYLLDLQTSTDCDMMYIIPLYKDIGEEIPFQDNYPYAPIYDTADIKATLEDHGICVLDPLEIVKEQNIDKYSLFFKTDHHWTPQTGVWITENICTQINETYHWDLDADQYDLSNFHIVTYPDSYLGSEGKRVGALFAGVDDFSVIKPIASTELSVDIPSEDCHVTGDFGEVFLDESNITPDDLLNDTTTAYNTYMQGNHDLVRIRNHNLPEGKKVLLVMDSYGCVVAPYLALSFGQLDCIDLRTYSASLEEYIRTENPDLVIFTSVYSQ